MDLNKYQREARKTQESRRGFVDAYGLVGEIGDVLSTIRKRVERGVDRYPDYRAQLSEEIGDTLWYLANLASKEGLRLNDVAAQNIDKTRRRSSTPRTYIHDKSFPADEKFPRKIEFYFLRKP
jgi:NTP pyrophosphatase (non-canonical NTP hydrolase)